MKYLLSIGLLFSLSAIYGQEPIIIHQIHIDSVLGAGRDAIHIEYASDDGLHIQGADDDGVHIEGVDDDGILSRENGGDGFQAENNQSNGFLAMGNGFDGFSASQNDQNGFYAFGNVDDGFFSIMNGANGFQAIQNGESGFLSSGNGEFGFRATENGREGFYSRANTGDGFYSRDNIGDGLYSSGNMGDEGYFDGTVVVTGNLSKGGGSFKIDHPLDPENKYLYHSFVESPDMMNVYNGNAILDQHGEAIVELEDWFEALNKDFRYQLTCIGGFSPVYVAEKIVNNQFKIAGGSPGLEVSWQVTGIRKDPYAERNRIPVVEEKPARFKGFYLHPEAYNQKFEKSNQYVKQGFTKFKNMPVEPANRRERVPAKPE